MKPAESKPSTLQGTFSIVAHAPLKHLNVTQWTSSKTTFIRLCLHWCT